MAAFVQTPTSGTNNSITFGAASLTANYSSTATAGNMLVAVIGYDSNFSVSTITSVQTVGGTGADTLSLVSDFFPLNPLYLAYTVFYVASCGAGRTGIIVTYSNGSILVLNLYEVSGLTSPVVDIIYSATPVIAGSSISGTTPSLATTVEAAILFGPNSNGYNAFTAGTWTLDYVDLVNTGSIYGHQVTSSATGLAATISSLGSFDNMDFGVVTFQSGSGGPAFIAKQYEILQAIKRSSYI